MPSRHSQAGSTLLWLIIWLAGMAAIAYWCVVRHMPALQQQIQTNAEAAVASVSVPGVNLAVDGRTAILSGVVSSDSKKTQLLSAVSEADGVRSVNDQLSIVGTAVADDQTDSVTPVSTDSANLERISPATPAENTESNPSTDDTSTSETVAADIQNSTITIASTDESSAVDTTADDAGDTTVDDSGDAPVDETKEASSLITETLEAEAVEVETTGNAIAGELSSETAAIEAAPAGNSVEAKAQALIEQARANQLSTTDQSSAASPATAVEAPNDTPTDAAETVEASSISTNPTSTVVAELAVPTAVEPIAPTNQSDTVTASQQPSFSMSVKGDTLNLSGEFSDKDNLLPFVQTAMGTFDSNYVINNVQVQQTTIPAVWLTALSEFLPSMKSIADASVEIVESQMTLSGIATSEQSHDDVIDKALSAFPDLSLVERISITADSEPKPTSAPIQTADAQEQTPAQTEDSNSTEQASSADADSSASQSLSEAFNSLDIERILFRSGSNVLTNESLRSVEIISDLFAQYPTVNIEINGHTDSQGSSSRNLTLSQLRANAVRDYLIQLGIDAQRLSAYGFGDGIPIADNNTAAGRTLNRRIEFNF